MTRQYVCIWCRCHRWINSPAGADGKLTGQDQVSPWGVWRHTCGRSSPASRSAQGTLVAAQIRAAMALLRHEDSLASQYLPQAGEAVRATAQVLGGQGAALDDLAPGGGWTVREANSPAAAAAQQWQCTAGVGPGPAARATGLPVIAPYAAMAQWWPGLTAHLNQLTPYRSVFALPVQKMGALVLYFTDPHGALTVHPADAALVARSAYRIYSPAYNAPAQEKSRASGEMTLGLLPSS